MIDRLEILASRIRYLVSRNRWSARLLGYRPIMGHEDEPGLILIQIDGLGEEVFRQALSEGKMPFTRHLIDDDGYGIHPLYSGMTSNTPAFQAELFHGVRGAVPGFGFRDKGLGRVVSMNHPSAAAAVESRLRESDSGLLAGGSAWSTIFTGGAAEPHLCASTLGPDSILHALNPLRVLGLVVWHGWSVVRVTANLVAELALAIWDFIRGTLEGRRFMQELRFVPERVAVTAVMREIVTAGVCIDAERGMPIVHVNFLGYDEHGHRRGPESRFARWTLRGIDRSVKRIWLAAHRSRFRDYQVWVFSDHGQESVVPYTTREGEGVREAVRRVYRAFRQGESDALEPHRGAPARGEDPPWGEDRREAATSPSTVPPFRGGGRPRRSRLPEPDSSERSRWLRRDLPEWMNVPEERPAARAPLPDESDAGELEVTDRGPVGFVYLPAGFDPPRTRALAEALSRDANIPTILHLDDRGGAWVWKAGRRRFHLPDDAAEIFGADHPHLQSVTEDTLRVVRHESAGALVLMGWDRRGGVSFKHENGAHGGPGPRETSAFLVVPPEMNDAVEIEGTLRPSGFREIVKRVLDPAALHLGTAEGRRLKARPVSPSESAIAGRSDPVSFRLMSYNVHGCRGMDGRYSTQRIARVIARARPDVICLQELDQSRTRSGGVDQVLEIARQLRSEFHFHAVEEVDDGRFGNAVLTHLPLTYCRSGSLPRIPASLKLEERGVLWVQVDVDGTSVQVLNTHLSILERERRIQVDALVRNWLHSPECRAPVLLAGDFNAPSVSYTARRIGEVLHDVSELDVRARVAGERIQHTWSGRVPLRRIDHVFTSAGFTVHDVEVPRTRLTRVASDHLPLVVDLAVARPESDPDRNGARRTSSP